MQPKCLGIFREITNSPNRENDDALILKAVGEELSKLGVESHLIEPANIPLINPRQWNVVMAMCENQENIGRLLSWKGPLFVNSIESIMNCYRSEMTDLIWKNSLSFYPPTEKRKIEELPGRPPSFINGRGCWIKRGDVHNTCSHDVQYVRRWKDSKMVKKDFISRKIKSVIVQEHIPGDLVKFYGVGPKKWFDWFYHRPQEVSEFGFSVKGLEEAAANVATSVGLEIYGGDAIITPESKIYIIDINSWPSFARLRNTAKKHISEYIYSLIATQKKGRTNENSGKKRKLKI